MYGLNGTDPVAPGTRGLGAQWAQHNANYRNQTGEINLAQRRRPDIKSMVQPNQLAGAQLPPFFGGGSQPTAQPSPGANTPPQSGNNGSQGSNIEVDTSVNPTGVYSDQQTREAQNLARARADQAANPAGMIEQYARPGISTSSPAILSQMIPQIAGALGQGQQAVETIPFMDAMTNAQHMLAGQVGREQEGLGMAGVLGGLNLSGQRAALQGQAGLLSLLNNLIGV